MNRWSEIQRFIEHMIGNERTAIIFGGIAGAIVSLAHQKKITFWQALIQIAVGATTAIFSVFLLKHFIVIESVEVAVGIGFFFGLIGMNITGGIWKYSKKFGDKPEETVEKWRQKKL